MASNWISDIQWDAQGRPYRTYLMDGPWGRAGDKTYVSPAEVSPSNTTDQRLLDWAAQHQAPGGGFLHGRGVWNDDRGQWDQPLNGGNLLSLGVGSLIAGPAIAGALGAGGSGALAAGESGVIPGTGIPAVGGTGVGLTAPPAFGATAGAAGGAGAAASRALTDVIKDPKTWIGLGATVPAFASALGAGHDNAISNDALQDEIVKSLALQRPRLEQAQPAYDTLVRMAYGLTPTGYRDGGTGGSGSAYVAPRFGGR